MLHDPAYLNGLLEIYRIPGSNLRPVAMRAEQAIPEGLVTTWCNAPNNADWTGWDAGVAATAGQIRRQRAAATRAGSVFFEMRSDGDEDSTDDLGRSCTGAPEFGELGPWQDAVGAAVRVVDLDLVAIEAEQDAIVPQV